MDEDKITILGADWCGTTKAAREYLDSKGVEYDYIDVDKHKEAEDFVYKANRDGTRTIPVVIFPSGNGYVGFDKDVYNSELET